MTPRWRLVWHVKVKINACQLITGCWLESWRNIKGKIFILFLARQERPQLMDTQPTRCFMLIMKRGVVTFSHLMLSKLFLASRVSMPGSKKQSQHLCWCCLIVFSFFPLSPLLLRNEVLLFLCAHILWERKRDSGGGGWDLVSRVHYSFF